MTRLAVTLATLLIAALAGSVAAQDGTISAISSGLVSFSVSDDDLAAAAACPGCSYVQPDPGPTIVFEVRRQNPNRIYTVDALHAGWLPSSGLRIEARYTVTTSNGASVLLRSAWLTLDEAPTLVFTQADVQRENRVRVLVEYRLALRGDEAAGVVATTLTHRIRENGSAISHDARASLPTTLTLRLVGATASATAFTLAFDYADDVAGYLASVTSGTPLRVTATDLALAQVSTNHPSGYTVRVAVLTAVTSDGTVDLRERLLLFGARAHGRSFTSSGPTSGFVTLFRGADYELDVDGDEAPGTYLLDVRLDAVRNP